MDKWDAFLKQAAQVRPSLRQLSWYETGFYAFAHFGVNTFTGREWGTGQEDPGIFNPTHLDCRQWVRAIRAAGMKGLVLTAKHHDGFCLWPSAHTEHSVKNSPYKGGKGDIVGEAAQACREGGIKFGFYLSPWDRNSPLYGTDAYNQYYKAQLTELLTGYGEIFHVWFDGACGEGPGGKRQAYDFEGYVELVRKYQPNATIFYDKGPDVRWIGNESGGHRHAEWAVVPAELCPLAQVQTGPGPQAHKSDLSFLYNTQDLQGDFPIICKSKGLVFCGAEVDMSIRPGWFYHEEEAPHSLERLVDTYIRSVGGNACFNLNIPPDKRGLFDERDVRRLAELGEALENAFSADLLEGRGATRTPGPEGGAQCQFSFSLPAPQKVRYIQLSENIEEGQRVEAFLIMATDGHGQWHQIGEGTTIGYKKIVPLALPEGTLLQHVKIWITSARDEVEALKVKAF